MKEKIIQICRDNPKAVAIVVIVVICLAIFTG